MWWWWSNLWDKKAETALSLLHSYESRASFTSYTMDIGIAVTVALPDSPAENLNAGNQWSEVYLHLATRKKLSAGCRNFYWYNILISKMIFNGSNFLHPYCNSYWRFQIIMSFYLLNKHSWDCFGNTIVNSSHIPKCLFFIAASVGPWNECFEDSF